jgi:hypothetical protein
MFMPEHCPLIVFMIQIPLEVKRQMLTVVSYILYEDEWHANNDIEECVTRKQSNETRSNEI